jgi:hypothetical protein
MCLEKWTIDGESPVVNSLIDTNMSKAKHEKLCLNTGGPSSKIKYE